MGTHWLGATQRPGCESYKCHGRNKVCDLDRRATLRTKLSGACDRKRSEHGGVCEDLDSSILHGACDRWLASVHGDVEANREDREANNIRRRYAFARTGLFLIFGRVSHSDARRRFVSPQGDRIRIEWNITPAVHLNYQFGGDAKTLRFRTAGHWQLRMPSTGWLLAG
jgi:hypothetical protein